MKTCLILEGGAMRGIYTAGVLDSFLEDNILVDAVFGVSAGALFGINYKSKQANRALRYNLKYVKDKNYMGIYSFLKTGNIMNKDFCFNKLVNEYDLFDYKTYNKNPIDFYAVVTNIETGMAEYHLINDLKNKDDMEYLRASGSMPFLSKKVKISNSYYLDGALGDSIPIKKAIELGYDKIIVVSTRVLGYQKKKHLTLLTKLRYCKYPNLVKTINNRYKKYNATLEFINKLEKNKNIIVIRPSKYIKIKRLEKNMQKIKEMYDLGYRDAKEQSAKIKEYLTS